MESVTVSAMLLARPASGLRGSREVQTALSIVLPYQFLLAARGDNDLQAPSQQGLTAAPLHVNPPSGIEDYYTRFICFIHIVIHSYILIDTTSRFR